MAAPEILVQSFALGGNPLGRDVDHRFAASGLDETDAEVDSMRRSSAPPGLRSCAGKTRPSSVRNAVGFSSAQRSRYRWPPLACSAPRIISFSDAVTLFGRPLRLPPPVLRPAAMHRTSLHFAKVLP